MQPKHLQSLRTITVLFTWYTQTPKLPSPEARLKKKSACFFITGLSRPPNHPLKDWIESAKKNIQPHPPPHLSPIESFFRNSKARALRDVRKLKPSPRHLVIFSVGSRTPGKSTGAAALAINTGRFLQRHLGPASCHTIYDGEMVGIELGLRLALRSASPLTTRQITLLLDNQSAISTTVAATSDATSGSHRQISHSLLCQLHQHFPTAKVTIRWCPGHLGVKGNERVDQLAKNSVSLPRFHRSPTSPAAALALVNAWAKPSFTDQEQVRLRRAIQPLATFQALSALPRCDTSWVSQLRSGHVPLNSFLFRFGLHSTPVCRCEGGNEMVEHYLLSCPLFDPERTLLMAPLHQINLRLSMKTLHTPEAFRAVAIFIRKTGRIPRDWKWSYH